MSTSSPLQKAFVQFDPRRAFKTRNDIEHNIGEEGIRID